MALPLVHRQWDVSAPPPACCAARCSRWSWNLCALSRCPQAGVRPRVNGTNPNDFCCGNRVHDSALSRVHSKWNIVRNTIKTTPGHLAGPGQGWAFRLQ
eukprot:4544274-Prymnesium_polylepis.1